MGFHRLHVSEVSAFKQRLQRMGFKNEQRGQWELFRMTHPREGIVIMYERNRSTPFPKINDNGWRIFNEGKEPK